MTMMHYKIVQRQASILVFGKNGVNYLASCQVFIYGDRGFMYAITGEDFYKCMLEHGVRILHDLRIGSLEGYVSYSHARLMRVALRRIADVEITSEGSMAGNQMVWVVVSEKIVRPSDDTLDIVAKLGAKPIL